jgi:hypothetical protein
MSLYDEYDGVQMKIGERAMHQYQPGDAVDIEDGVYVGWEGVVVIHGGRLIRAFPTLRSKHGEAWDADAALRRLMDTR